MARLDSDSPSVPEMVSHEPLQPGTKSVDSRSEIDDLPERLRSLVKLEPLQDCPAWGESLVVVWAQCP